MSHKNIVSFMQEALKLAKKGVGLTSPNPPVGAVIVKNNRIIGKGFHKKAGEDHAEIIAIKNAIKNSRNLNGSELYVTLEPCCFSGRTPACTNAIIESGIKKVFIGVLDPNKKVNGKGIEELKKNNIKVEYGFLENKINEVIEPFKKSITKNMPFVTMKTAMSIDGKIALEDGTSKWITGKKAREFSHNLRVKCDAILVGINTIIKDNPHLGARNAKGRDPVRIIIDPLLKIPLKSKVLRDKNVIIATTKFAKKDNIKKVKNMVKNLLVFKSKTIELKKLLKKIKQIGINHVLIEGGSNINTQFIENKLFDEIYFFIAPKIIGGKKSLQFINSKNSFNGINGIPLKIKEIKKIDKDILIHYKK